MNPPLFRNSILARAELRPDLSATSLQSQVDGLVGGFAEQATDWRSLAAMMAGGMAYRVGRIGVMGLGSGKAVRAASIGLGLTAEVSTFEMAHRSLASVGSPLHGENPNLWRWLGSGGIRQGLLQSFVTFGALKSAGHLARGENLILQHLAQDTAMVAGHQISGALNLAPRPAGSLAEQFLEAEATNLQLGAGMALAHRFVPGLHALERGLDLSFVLTNSPRLSVWSLLSPETAGAPTWAVREIASEGGAKDPTSFFMVGTPRDGREGPRPPREALVRLPVFAFKGTESFYGVIEPLLNKLPPDCRCLLIDLNVKALNNLGRLAELLKAHSSLQEIRIRYSDGSLRWFLKEEGLVRDDQEESASGSWFDVSEPHRPDQVFHVALQTLWKTPELSEAFPDLLKRLRLSAGFSTFRAAAREAEEKWGLHLDTGTLSLYESEAAHPPTFEILQALARLYHADVRDLIYVSNRTRYPDLSEKAWMTPYYPLLIEREWEPGRLEFYRRTDGVHQSQGWLLFSSRKDPFRYGRITELAEAAGLSSDQLSALEQNQSEPHLLTMRGVARAYGIEESRFIRTINYTFHRDLIPAVKKLFPGRVIYIDPKSEDPDKIRYYSAHPQSLGRLLFQARKALPGYPSNVDLSGQIKRHEAYVSDREWDRVELHPSFLPEWVWFFRRLGLNPETELLPRFPGPAITPESPRYLLAEAMEGLSQNELSARAGIKPDALIRMLSEDPGDTHPETLLSLRRALPNLDRQFFRPMVGEALKFFPELAGSSVSLSLRPEDVEKARAIELGEMLFAYRMDHSLSRDEAGKILGVSQVPVKNIESRVTNVEEDGLLLRAATLLGLNPRLVYLRYRPHLLELFPPTNPSSGQALTDIPAFASNDSAALRRKLWQALNRRGVTEAKDFANLMGLDASSVRRFLHSYPLNLDEILLLKEKLPELSAREWYEHFHRSILVYFLGKNADGSVNYGLPDGFTWSRPDPQNLYPLIQEAVAGRFSSSREAAQKLGLTFLGKPYQLRGVLNGRWREETIARIAKDLDLDRRLLFFYFRGPELKKLLEAEGNPVP